ncbi:hypothetical protein GS429_13970 [Natronorubrum sp. JWXQ-INN-674]|uniref:Uncharacterized protein n=1 Tax=Natronorubrum halalkaliphilum TaxID=2691917 RepID=A0A6B0VPG8_9EURY|nr:hypothetical protein [Natronorubrum halalkaliphilum]
MGTGTRERYDVPRRFGRVLDQRHVTRGSLEERSDRRSEEHVPTAAFAGPEMPEVAKVMLIFNMWIGRLEIIPVAVLLGVTFRSLNLYR